MLSAPPAAPVPTLSQLLACCAHSGSLTDNSKELLSRFEISRLTCCGRERGVKLELINPPEDAFG
ncbi:DUF4478 domain-containing protein [Klebsiella pneumoniae]|nr:DUF4478 domain-containing protein [Klebsiella pneumoniae]